MDFYVCINMVGIYKITSPSGKIYIGQSENIDIRWRYSYYNLCCKQQPKLYNSLKKYGVKNHIFEILEECSLELLNEREIYWKLKFVNILGWEKTLFCEIYDTGGGPKSTSTKDKISIALKGRKHSEESKKKMSLKALGRKYSDEDKQKMSLAKKGKKFNEDQKINMRGKQCKPIIQYNLNGDFIKEWKSFKEISNELGFYNSGLCFCCRGIQKTAYGFVWKYKE